MSYINEIIIHSFGSIKASNGSARSANYRDAYDECIGGKRPTVEQAKRYYPPRNGVTIIDDPLDIYEGGFRNGTVFAREEWQSMLMNCALVDGTLIMDRGVLWQVYTYTNYRGTQRQKKRKVSQLSCAGLASQSVVYVASVSQTHARMIKAIQACGCARNVNHP